MVYLKSIINKHVIYYNIYLLSVGQTNIKFDSKKFVSRVGDSYLRFPLLFFDFCNTIGNKLQYVGHDNNFILYNIKILN